MNTSNFTQSLIQYQPELLRFAYKLTSDTDEANDLVQETSLRALDNIDKYSANTNFKGWIFTIMRNTFINNYRKIIRNQNLLDQSEAFYQLTNFSESGCYFIESEYNIKEIYGIINKLTPDYRIPFALYVAGFKYREIAERLDLPVGTVKSRIFLTKQKLQEKLKDFI